MANEKDPALENLGFRSGKTEARNPGVVEVQLPEALRRVRWLIDVFVHEPREDESHSPTMDAILRLTRTPGSHEADPAGARALYYVIRSVQQEADRMRPDLIVEAETPSKEQLADAIDLAVEVVEPPVE